jgi:GH15 family glucan-1,4-alpha-glucosidase
MWELPEARHYTSSKMGCWQALNAAIQLCEAGQLDGPVERWQNVRDEIRAWIQEECWSEEIGSYVMFPGTRQLDASVLLHAPSGFDRGERMASTMRAIRAELGRGALLYRYSSAVGQEKPFVACSFWLAAALASVGELDDAEKVMNGAVALANDVGLFSEMISEDDLSFWGNLPQGLSHLSLIDAAITIERNRDHDDEGSDEGT